MFNVGVFCGEVNDVISTQPLWLSSNFSEKKMVIWPMHDGLAICRIKWIVFGENINKTDVATFHWITYLNTSL